MNPEYEALQQVQDALHIFLKGLQEFMPIPVQRVSSCNVYPNPEFQSYDCYAQYSNEPTNYDDEFRQVHDELHNAVLTADEHEGTPLAMLADHLQQYGQPGGLLMAEGAKYRPNGFQRLYHTEDVDSIRDSNGEANVYIDPVHRHDVPGFASIQAVKREVPVKEPRTGSYLRIYHNSYSAPQEIGIDYRVPVLSHRHLNEMLADLPEHVRQKTIEHVYHADPNLPEDHEEPQQLSRYDDDSFGYPSFTDMRLPPPTIPGSIAPGSTQSLEQFGSPWVSPAGFPKQAQAGRQFSRYADGDPTDYAAPINEIHEILNSAPGAGSMDPNAYVDHVLVGKLADHDDPRATIVDRDVSYRSSADNPSHHGVGNGWLGNLHRHAEQLAGGPVDHRWHPHDGTSRRVVPTGDGGTLQLTGGWYPASQKWASDAEARPVVHAVNWTPTENDEPSYSAAMTPDEVSHLYAHFGHPDPLSPHSDVPTQSGGHTGTMYTLDLGETIRQGVENSQRQWADEYNHNYVQDTTAGGVLADALDEAGEPHAPFYRNLVESGSPLVHNKQGISHKAQLAGEPSTVVRDGDQTWTIRSTDVPGSALVHRRTGGSLSFPSHTAVMDAPSLREWADHPKVSPTLRARLLNSAEYLESQTPPEQNARYDDADGSMYGFSGSGAGGDGQDSPNHDRWYNEDEDEQSNYDDTGDSAGGFSGGEHPDRDYWRNKTPYSRTDYSHQAFQARAQEAPHDAVNRQIYADWLEDYAPHTVHPDTLNFLRTHQGNAWISTHPQTGEVKAGPHYTWDDIRKANGETSHFNEMFPNEHYGWVNNQGERHTSHGEPHSGPGGVYFTSRDDFEGHDGEEAHDVWQFHPDTGGISHEAGVHGNVGEFPEKAAQQAHQTAHQLSQTHPPVPQQASGLEQREVSEDVNFSRYGRTNYDFGDTDVTESYDEHMGTHYVQSGDPDTHDAMMHGIVSQNDASGLGPFADFLEEQGMPGAHLARQAYWHSRDPEQMRPPFYPGLWFPYDYSIQLPSVVEDGTPGPHGPTPHQQIGLTPHISKKYYDTGARSGALTVTHAPHGNPLRFGNGGYLQYHVPVDSKEHLAHLTQDLPEPMRQAIHAYMEPHLPSQPDFQPQMMSRYSRTDYVSEQELPAMLSSISPRAWRGWQHEQSPHFDMTPRLVAADYLDDLHADTGNQDYARQAAILRDTRKHAYLDPDGGIQDAHALSQQLHRQYRPNIQGYMIRPDHLEPGFQQYMDTALWSSTDPDAGEPLDENHTYHNIHPATMAAMLADFRHFRATNQEKLADTSSGSSDHAHDFWVSRNGHGAGFWEKPEVYGDHGYDLQDAAEKHGEHDLYVGSDGMIHGSYEVQPTQDEPTQAARYSRMDYMTSEEDFHRMLDETPHDHQTRMILADYLEDQNDPRAAGYRALGMHRRYATHWNPKAEGYDGQPYPESWDWGHDENSHYPNVSNALPRDWLDAMESTNPSYANAQDREYWTHHESRRAADDAAALGFARLHPERQAELLGQSQQTQAAQYSDTAWSSGGGTLHEDHSDFRGKDKPFEGQRYYPEAYQESVNYDYSPPQQEWQERDDIADWVSQSRTHLNNYPNLSPVMEQDGDQRYSMYARTDYSHEAFHHAIQEHPNDTVARGVYADWLEEKDPNSVSPDTLHFLRNHPGDAWVAHHPQTGEVHAGAIPTFDDIRKANGEEYGWTAAYGGHPSKHYGFFPSFGVEGSGEHIPHGPVHSGIGGHYFVTEGEGFPENPNPHRYDVWKFHPQDGGISLRMPSRWMGHSQEEAHRNANELSQTPPVAPAPAPRLSEDTGEEHLSLYADDDSSQEQWTDPHAAFQASIYPELGGNPLDPMGHYVYSDFLREQGHHDEADFRQAMGDWHSQNHGMYDPQQYLSLKNADAQQFPHRIYSGSLPSGVDPEHLPQYRQSHRDGDFYTAPDHVPRFIGMQYSWPTYKGMEAAFHQSFMANRQQGQTG